MARHRLDDEDDVRRRLDQMGIDSAEDIRRAHGSRRHRIERVDDARRLDLYATGAPNAVAADIDALRAALAGLRGKLDTLDELIDRASDLGTGMQDGHGPIAANIRPTFRNKAHGERGLLRAMRRYRAELVDVITVIEQSLNAYSATDVNAAAHLNAAGGNHG